MKDRIEQGWVDSIMDRCSLRDGMVYVHGGDEVAEFPVEQQWLAEGILSTIRKMIETAVALARSNKPVDVDLRGCTARLFVSREPGAYELLIGHDEDDIDQVFRLRLGEPLLRQLAELLTQQISVNERAAPGDGKGIGG